MTFWRLLGKAPRCRRSIELLAWWGLAGPCVVIAAAPWRWQLSHTLDSPEALEALAVLRLLPERPPPLAAKSGATCNCVCSAAC